MVHPMGKGTPNQIEFNNIFYACHVHFFSRLLWKILLLLFMYAKKKKMNKRERKRARNVLLIIESVKR